MWYHLGGSGMTCTLHVLFVGSIETHEPVWKALFTWRPTCRLLTASGIANLSDFSASENVSVAILHDTLSVDEMQNCSTYIRHHWSYARILLIHSRADVLDDPLYDERILPGASAGTLLGMLERLEAGAQPRASTNGRKTIGWIDEFENVLPTVGPRKQVLYRPGARN